MKKYDFHLHTNASDGKLSSRELVALAKKENIELMAITDHDNTDGIEAGIKAAKELNVNLIPGIELSTQHNHESIHVLGYFPDYNFRSKNFQDFLNDMKNQRLQRGKKIVDNLYKYFNIRIDYDKLISKVNGVIARPHIAREIISSGYDYSWEYIFNNIISSDSPAYVPNKKLSVEDGLKVLKSVNAVTVLAHPVLIKNTPAKEIVHYAFDGIEAVYSQNTQEDTEFFIKLAKENGKVVTCGSDFHGGDAGDKKHGYIGSTKCPEELLTPFLGLINKNGRK